MRTQGLAISLALFGLAACSDFTIPGSVKKQSSADTQGKLMARATPLWDDPQNTPHPAFNYPTLSHPPEGEMPPFWRSPQARALPRPVTGIEHVAQVDVPGGGGMATFGGLAVLPGFGNESSLVDIRDPQNPQRLAGFNKFFAAKAAAKCANGAGQFGETHRGAAIIAYPSGRLVTVISTNTVIEVWDITDPNNPRELPPLPTARSHKVGVVPGTPIVYNAATQGGGDSGAFGDGTGVTEIFDLSDPENAVHVQDFDNGYSCHHVFFWNNREQNKYRAICAGVEFTQIWDTQDPRRPEVIVSLPVHLGMPGTPSFAVSPLIFSHSAGLNRDGTTLYVGDEAGGGGIPPGCAVSVNTPLGDPSTPLGAVWFYDVTDEKNPLFQGWYSALNDPRIKSPLSSCTAHHGRLVPDADGRDLLAMGFYGDGLILVDFTNPRLPHAVGQFAQGSNTWEAAYNNGYLITGDLNRGMDILTLK